MADVFLDAVEAIRSGAHYDTDAIPEMLTSEVKRRLARGGSSDNGDRNKTDRGLPQRVLLVQSNGVRNP